MKQKLLYLSLCLWISVSLYAQAPVLQWQKALGGSLDDLGTSIIQTADGGFITAGYASSEDGDVTGAHGNDDFWVVKLSSTGTVSWQKAYGGVGTDVATGIIQLADGGYVVSGFSESNDGDVTGNRGYADVWIIKINATGVLQWQKTYGGSNADWTNSIAKTTDGGFIVAGLTYSYDGDITENQDYGDAWVIKCDASGVMQWQKSYGASNYDEANVIKQTADGGYIFAGNTYSSNGIVTGNHGRLDYWVVKINATGVFQWQKALGGSLDDEAEEIIQTSDGGYLVTGFITSPDGNITGYHDDYDAWVVKLSSTGVLEWQRALGGTREEKGFSAIEAADGGFIVMSSAQSRNGDLTLAEDGSGDYWILKLSALGVLQWHKTFGGSQWEEPSNFIKTNDGGFAISGYTSSYDGDVTDMHGSKDYWVVKLGGELGTTDVTKTTISLFPNPASDLLQINSPNESIQSVKIFDMNGKMVLHQTQNCQTINISTLAQGSYILEASSQKNKYPTKFIKK